MRQVCFERKTRETEISLCLNLDGKGEAKISLQGFMAHMLDTFARHGMFDLELKARAHLDPDGHHLTEDLGIAVGEAVRKAIGEAKGLKRFGHSVIPMDEALVQVALDLSGRCWSSSDLGISDYVPTAHISEFFKAFSRRAGATLHIRVLAGTDPHHIGEAAFKAFARALAEAVRIDARLGEETMSAKGTLS